MATKQGGNKNPIIDLYMLIIIKKAVYLKADSLFHFNSELLLEIHS
jgi:hypothetical protein